MRNNRSKLKVVIPLLAALAAGRGYAENIDDSFFYKTGDGILVTNYRNPLPRDKDINVDSLISGGNVTSLTVVDPIPVLKEKIKFLKDSKRARNFYHSEKDKATQTSEDESRLRLINIYEGLLEIISQEKRTPEYYKSLEKLAKSLSVKDHIITTKELEGILGGFTYAIDKKGTDPVKGAYDVPMLVYFQPESPTLDSLKEYFKYLPGRALTEEEKKVFEKKKEKSKETPLVFPEPSKETEKERIGISLVTEANIAFDNFSGNNTFGGAVGVRFNSPKGKRIGFGILLDGSLSLDKLVDSYTSPLSAGRSAYGTVKDTNTRSIGILAELQSGPFFIGTGVNYESWINNITEQILDASGNVLKSNINSVPKGEISGKSYFGLELGPENWKARLTAGYNYKHGIYFGLGTVIRLNPKKEKKE